MRYLPVILYLCGLAGAAAQTSKQSIPIVEAHKISAQQIHSLIQVYGTVEADATSIHTMASRRAGTVSDIRLVEGDKVTAGQTVLTYQSLASDQSQMEQAQASVDFQQQHLRQIESLFKNHLVNITELDDAKRQLKVANAVLKALKSEGKNHTVEQIVSPLDGIIYAIKVENGQRFPADSTLFTLIDEAQMKVRLGVAESDLPNLTTDSGCQLYNVFNPQVKVICQITSISHSINTSTGLVDVLATLPAGDLNAFPLGTHVSATLTLNKHSALVVPQTAVKQDIGGHFLFIINQGIVHKKYVDTGAQLDDQIEIVKGLSPGQTVVISGNNELTDTTPVKVKML
ncbi:efflux RND transporter periplasmic adaptor subunit [Neptunicella marina]|uniref:Efflux RND transporter periplasmic adaptor subunit n=1 Tax=Neptunicella marina TaxID=2125989 RepID=A0A8J6IVQ8_9ALTE|nr:efflux RND transporter periplasmic adaptor subunit [Neptunicella marina]MBC3767551.1 efflux RND transporter periplasmic adaptor subunit [Neptunicella marina]